MDKVTLINKIKEIGTCENDSNRLELLAQLQEEAVQDYDRFSGIEQENKQLSDDIKDLQSTNMKLFLRISEKVAPGDDRDEGKREKREFKNLFNEKGEIL